MTSALMTWYFIKDATAPNMRNWEIHWVLITNKSQIQAQTQDRVLCSGFNLRLRNDYQNPEIVFVLRPEHKTRESRDWYVPFSRIILKS